ncbi:LCP family protein [Streptomyces calidiresistens]|uniref:LytR family transcriptional regulator n=1 Tax=Streptomyces calidiresistens TaxID=1485586 RepID=A0A7W3XX22_9ACTN|nr:LCP family protein [Streptomyces calidiresistens]MBB0230660.1 LytR family transcriptional regulator [Streptomyces calidiresistens]
MPVKRSGGGRRRWLRGVTGALGLALVGTLALALGAGWWLYRSLDDNITTDHAAAEALEAASSDRPPAGAARTVLVIGSDREGGHPNERSDTVVLLRLAAEGDRADVVHVPRDLIVDIPRCAGPDGGGSTPPSRAQFNWAFQFGGAACTIRTLEELTGVRIDHHMVVDFSGFVRFVDAVGGVEVEVTEDESDWHVGHELTAGRHLLDGREALAYVRARQLVGDGSDLNRIARQQEFFGLLYARARSDSTLINPARLYPVLEAATSSLTTDAGLDSPAELYALARRLREVPRDGLVFRTVPVLPHPELPNRLALDGPAAEALFAELRDSAPEGGSTASD